MREKAAIGDGDDPSGERQRKRREDSIAAVAFESAFRKDGAAGYERERRADLQRRVDSMVAVTPPPSELDTVPPLRENRIATLYAQLGDWTRAMDWVLKEHGRRPKRFRLYVANPDFAGLRIDPRFMVLVRQEGLESLVGGGR